MPSSPVVQHYDLGAFTINGANNAFYYAFAPTRIHRIFYMGTTANDATATLTISVTEADTTAADPTGASLATMAVTAGLSAANLVTALDIQEVYGDLILYPGERLVITSDGGGTTGAGRLGLAVEALGDDSDVDIRSHVSGHPGSTQRPTALAGVTFVTA